MPRDCPKCGLVNPSEAQRCDCGYDFEEQQMRRSYLTEQDRKNSHEEKDSLEGPLLVLKIMAKILGLFR